MTTFLQLLVAGIAVGALYALVALGFVVIYTATGVINFAQGALLLIGAYFSFGLSNVLRSSEAFQSGFLDKIHADFILATVLAMLLCGGVGLLIERVILRRMVGQPVFAVIMITIGLTIAFEQLVIWRWTGNQQNFDDPWGLDKIDIGGVTIPWVNIVRIIVAGILLAGFFLFFKFSRMGVAMRATAADQEAAMAQGISAKRVFGVSWAVASAIAALAGVLLASGGRGLDPSLGVVALIAFPAIILGGLDSPVGAVVGGVVMGIVEQTTAGYQEHLPDVLGNNFNRVTPYVVLVAILLLRPYGLFGTKEVQRV